MILRPSQNGAIFGNVGELLDTLLAQAADMDIDGDGECDAISLVFTFDSVPSFLLKNKTGQYLCILKLKPMMPFSHSYPEINILALPSKALI